MPTPAWPSTGVTCWWCSSAAAIAAAVELDGAQVVRFAEARGTNPDRFRSDEDPGRERTFESIGF